MSVYAFSDLHGRYDLLKQVLNFLKEDDVCYFLGDAADRGPDGIKVMKKLFTDKRFICLKGNHDDFFLECVPLLVEGRYDRTVLIWLDPRNGGDVTWKELSSYKHTEIKWFVNKVSKLPFDQVYHSPVGHTVILEHAGYTPGIQHRSHDPLWDRSHFYDKWDMMDEGLSDVFVVHGHTPVQALFTYEWKSDDPVKIKRYCNGHKFDIDMGSFNSGVIALLDLDTFEEYYFNEKGQIAC